MASSHYGLATPASQCAGFHVFAPTQDTAEVGTFRLGTYNIGAQNSAFEKISEEVYALSTCTDVLCLQSISPGWVTRLVDVLKWHVIDANDWTATLWRHGMHMTIHARVPFFPDDERRNRLGCSWAALRLKRAFWLHGSAWGRAFLLSGPSASGSSTVDP